MTLDAKTNMKNIAASADTNEKTDPAIPFSNKYDLKKLLLAPKKNWDLTFVNKKKAKRRPIVSLS